MNELEVGEAQHPRRSIGPAKDLPHGFIYWCLSCDRRVKHYNQPFCTRRHQAQREKYVRDRRREKAKPVKVQRDDLRIIHESARSLGQLRTDLLDTKNNDERHKILRKLLTAIEDFEHFVHTTVPTGEVVVTLRGNTARTP